MSEGCCSKSSCCSGGTEDVPAVSTALSFEDMLGAWKVRFGIARMDYLVKPGLYAVGKPNSDSPVLVSANYKLTFDTLRKNLVGLDCWLLILDTKGVNVWCAAGKGTFGTCELVHRIEAAQLSEIVTHRRVIVPQLGASGVNAHEVTRRTGFSVTFGPVRASDIQAFIASGCKATKEMRTVQFTLRDRLVLTPIELVEAAKKSLLVFGVLFLINFIAVRPFGIYDVAVYVGAVIVGTVLMPVLLPYIPGRAFAWKGWILGLCWTVFALWVLGWYTAGNWLLAAGYLLLLPMASAFLALNFTGCSTFTSPSGVLKEMRITLPLIIAASIIGVVLILIHKLI
ncbi:MAG: mercury methylation corrinoid protein HgcA [Euryarchaeota archaeon]|nr:mercury methylation corrinoid protein HgcA [Euryarchaeota archaeon]